MAKLVDKPRFVRVFVTKGNHRMPVNLSEASYELLAAGFERRGYRVEKAQP